MKVFTPSEFTNQEKEDLNELITILEADELIEPDTIVIENILDYAKELDPAATH
jgi:hypothetical protein